MKVFDGRRSRVATRVTFIALFLVFTVPAIWAISLYDIIQLTKKGYRDDQIIAMIDATGSRFETDADTLLTLKREGVHEKVIQAIIAASDGPPAAQPPASSNDPSWRTAPVQPAEQPGESRPHEHAADATRSGSAGAMVAPSRVRTNAPLMFSALAFEEAAAGHHQHYALALGDVPVIILRDEAGFPTVGERAQAAADVLNRAAAGTSTLFASRGALFAQMPNGAAAQVLKIEHADVIGLQRRSVGRIASDRVGAYWAALLGDYVDLASGREPRRLVSHGISGVQMLYRELSPVSDGSATISSDALRAAIDRLPGDDREALIDLAGYIPAKFRPSEESQ